MDHEREPRPTSRTKNTDRHDRSVSVKRKPESKENTENKTRKVDEGKCDAVD